MVSFRSRVWAGLMVSTMCVSAAHAQSYSSRSAKNAAPTSQEQTQAYVDARMHETLTSIDQSLNKLMVLTRGGEAASKPGIIGATAAGNNGVARSPIVPPAMPVDASILKRRMQIQWNGSAEGLLRAMSQQLGFTFNARGLGKAKPTVRLEGEHLTVEETLNLIAKQLHGKADIVVSLSKSQIELVGRTP